MSIFKNIVLWFSIKTLTARSNILKVDFVNKKRIYNRWSKAPNSLIYVDFANKKKLNVLPFPPPIPKPPTPAA